jgi:hypothetical protein
VRGTHNGYDGLLMCATVHHTHDFSSKTKVKMQCELQEVPLVRSCSAQTVIAKLVISSITGVVEGGATKGSRSLFLGVFDLIEKFMGKFCLILSECPITS